VTARRPCATTSRPSTRAAQFDEALADFDRAIGLDQDFAAAYYNRGRVHTAMGRSAEARADLKSAYDLGFGRLQAQE
jgi:tetratricopeptide (TPR) repeat protein